MRWKFKQFIDRTMMQFTHEICGVDQALHMGSVSILDQHVIENAQPQKQLANLYVLTVI